MARITIEDCLEKIDNHFKLVLTASHRAQQLQAGVAPKIEESNEKPTIIALREIAEGLIDESILDEPLIQDPTAEDELAELIAHGLMNQEVATELDDMAEDAEDEDEPAEMDTLETGTETIEEMEKIADLNLDHLKAGDDTPGSVASALTNKLSESEIAMGDKLLTEAGETGNILDAETNDRAITGEPANELGDKPKDPGGYLKEDDPAEEEPA